MSDDKKTTSPSSGGGGMPAACGKVPCPLQVNVSITLSAAVACPGHPLAITAAGTPSGGTYSWSVSGGGAELVDGSGNPVSTGPDVNLRSFQSDNSTGKIPAKSVTVSVTYTHPNGTAKDSKPVPIHAIDFEVTDTAITAGVTQANESAGGVTLGGAPGIDTMVTDPKVKIKLDPSCPRKTACASNHRVGWLQTVVTNDRRTQYKNTLITLSVPLPIRDGDPAAGPSPFPFYDAAPDFIDDKDTQTAHHFDSPGQGAAWIDPRPLAPAPPPASNRQLKKMFFQNSFKAWLVVQNKEWSKHDLPGSFAYQKNFEWSIHLDVDVDMSKAVGSRCSPASANPTIPAMANGKGSGSPVLTAPVPNDEARKPSATTIVAIP